MTTTRPNLAAWRLWQQSRGYSERTIHERITLVSRVDDLSREGITQFLSNPKLSNTTKATYYAHIRACIKWQIFTDQLDADPLLRIPAPKRPRGQPRPLTDQQLLALLAVANRSRTRTMVLLGAFAGLRVHEIAKMHGSDIDPWSNTLTVKGKGGKTSVVPLHALLAEEAKMYPSNGFWFPSYEQQNPAALHIDRRAVGSSIGRAMTRAGLRTTPHQLRHYFATTLLQSGIDIRVVQRLMRHDSISSTQIYTLVSNEQERAGIASMIMPVALPRAA